MKKSNFIALILGTVSGVLFSLGMCMALLPEWNAFTEGVIFGCTGLVLGFVTLLIWRRMEHKAPLHLSGKNVLFIFVSIAGIRLMNILTGTAVCLLIFLLGLNLIGGKHITMAKSKLVKANEKIAETVVKGYKKVEDTVVGGYKKVEETVVGAYTKVEDKFVDKYLTREGETVEEAKARLKKDDK